MRDYHIRHLPVVDGHHLVGIVSSGDIRRASPSGATTLSVWELRALWEKVTVREVMSRQLVKVERDTPLLEAVRLMYEHRFNCLPVIDGEGRLVGILTEVDLYRLLLERTEPMVAGVATQPDDEHSVAALS